MPALPTLVHGGGDQATEATVVGRLGTDLGRLLISAGIRPVILDHDEANVSVLRRFGFEVYYEIRLGDDGPRGWSMVRHPS